MGLIGGRKRAELRSLWNQLMACRMNHKRRNASRVSGMCSLIRRTLWTGPSTTPARASAEPRGCDGQCGKGQALYNYVGRNLLEQYETPYKPLVLPNGLSQEGQSAQKWTLECLRRKYRNQKFKRGEDKDGYSMKMKMGCYIEYRRLTNDSPFTSLTAATGNTPKEGNFRRPQVPKFFTNDLLQFAGRSTGPLTGGL